MRLEDLLEELVARFPEPRERERRMQMIVEVAIELRDSDKRRIAQLEAAIVERFLSENAR